MPFFNFRRGGSSSAPHVGSNAQPESVEVIRKRAKHRLIGAAVLVLAGVVGFPLLFDTQPRPIAVDIPIEIPGKNAVKPLATAPKTTSATSAMTAMPAPLVAAAPTPAALASAATVADTIAAASSLTSTEEIVTEKKAVATVPPVPLAIKNEAKPVLKTESKLEAKSEETPTVKAAMPADDGARAKALLNGQTASPIAANPAPTATETRMVVQVGAFADVTKAREARLKLEKAGLKTYTQVAETSGGKRIRVRVGPFASKAEAEKAASKIKSLDLPATILTL